MNKRLLGGILSVIMLVSSIIPAYNVNAENIGTIISDQDEEVAAEADEEYVEADGAIYDNKDIIVITDKEASLFTDREQLDQMLADGTYRKYVDEAMKNQSDEGQLYNDSIPAQSISDRGAEAANIVMDGMDFSDYEESPLCYTLYNPVEKNVVLDTSEYGEPEIGPRFIDLPELRNQNPYGACWAFSSIFLFEAAMEKAGFADSSVDLSELALAYCTYYIQQEPLGGFKEDRSVSFSSDGYMDLPNETESFLNKGGNSSYAVNTITKWTGLINESVSANFTRSRAEYVRKYGYTKEELEMIVSANMIANIKEAYHVDTKDINEIKRLVYENGAATVDYWNDRTEYNSEYNCYFTDVTEKVSHAVAIIGWDDNFPADHFTSKTGKKPSNNGAWLIRNQWANPGTPLYNYNSYFWMSYEEPSMTDVWVYTIDSSDKYDNNYQMDGSPVNNTVQLGKAVEKIQIANVFEAGASVNGEELEAVSFATANTNLSYKIDIYTDPESGNPCSGTLVNTTVGKTTYEGYINVPLSESVHLKHGQKYSVVITLEKAGDTVKFVVEQNSKEDNWFYAGRSNDQSFFKRATDVSWIDVADFKNNENRTIGNIRIKAFTCNSNNEYVEPTGVTILSDIPEQGLEIMEGNEFKVAAKVTNDEASTVKINWSVSDNSIASVDKYGTIKAIQPGTTRVRAGVINEITGELLFTEFTVIVKGNLLKSIAIDINGETEKATIRYAGTGKINYKLYPDLHDFGEDDLKWKIEKPGFFTIDKSGNIIAEKCGSSKVTLSIGNIESNTIKVGVYPRIISCNAIVDESDNSVVITWDGTEEASSYIIRKLIDDEWSNVDTVEVTKDNGSYRYVDRTYCDSKEPVTVGYYVRVESSGMMSGGTARTVNIIPSFNIIYNVGEYAEGNGDNPATVKYGEKLVLKPAEAMEGYSFAGWYLDSEFTNPVTSIESVTKSYTLFAKFDKVLLPDVEPPVDEDNNEFTVNILKGGKINIDSLASVKGTKWNVSYDKKKVATISKKGQIKAKKVGTVVATVVSGEKTYKVNINVADLPFDKSVLKMNKGDIVGIKLVPNRYIPVFSSNKPDKLIVNKDTGIVSANAIGKYKVSLYIGGKKFIKKVQVYDPVIKGKDTVAVGKSIKLSVKNGTGKTMFFTSNPAVATVSKSGKLKAINTGTVEITAFNNGREMKKTIVIHDR